MLTSKSVHAGEFSDTHESTSIVSSWLKLHLLYLQHWRATKTPHPAATATALTAECAVSISEWNTACKLNVSNYLLQTIVVLKSIFITSLAAKGGSRILSGQTQTKSKQTEMPEKVPGVCQFCIVVKW